MHRGIDTRQMPEEEVKKQAKAIMKSPCMVCSKAQKTIRKMPFNDTGDVIYVPLCGEHSMMLEERILSLILGMEN